MRDKIILAFIIAGLLVYVLCARSALFADYVGGFAFVRILVVAPVCAASALAGALVAALVDWAQRP